MFRVGAPLWYMPERRTGTFLWPRIRMAGHYVLLMQFIITARGEREWTAEGSVFCAVCDFYLLCPPCVADANIIFLALGFLLFSSPNLSRRRLDVYDTSTHGVALVDCCADCGCSVFDFALFISQNLPGYSSLFVVYLALWVDLCSVYNITVRLIE